MEGENVVEFLKSAIEQGGFQTDDIVSSFVPLLKQVANLHEKGLVAPLDNILSIKVSNRILWFENASSSKPRLNTSNIERLQAAYSSSAFSISGQQEIELEADGDLKETENKQRPRHLAGYKSWEIEYCNHLQTSY